jgi:hypothetical protein
MGGGKMGGIRGLKAKAILPLVVLGVLFGTVAGCLSKRVLYGPLSSGAKDPALVAYAANPSELMEKGKDDTGQMGYEFFDQWLHDAVASGCNKFHYFYFDPQLVLRSALKKGALTADCPILTPEGQPTQEKPFKTYPDESLPSLSQAASQLGATHLVKVKLLDFRRKEHYRNDKVKGNFVRLDIACQVTVFALRDTPPGYGEIYDQPVTVSEDNDRLFGTLYGGGDVKKELAEKIYQALSPNNP